MEAAPAGEALRYVCGSNARANGNILGTRTRLEGRATVAVSGDHYRVRGTKGGRHENENGEGAKVSHKARADEIRRAQ